MQIESTLIALPTLLFGKPIRLGAVEAVFRKKRWKKLET